VPAPAVVAAAPAGEAVDPVCGMTVAVSEATLSFVDNGTTVHFCGPGCRQAYADDPARYRS
jgi:xanthine dehydrogenase accessory factor